MNTFLALVGFQPSAIAVAVKTWQQHDSSPARLILLATSQTRTIAERLRRWSRGMPCNIIPIDGSPQSIEQTIPELLKTLKTDRLIFLGDPGPKFLVVSIVRLLPSSTVFVHADTDQLHICQRDEGSERWQTSLLVDLGLGPFLQLYGLQLRRHPDLTAPLLDACLRNAGIGLPAHIRRHVTFKGIDGPPFTLVFESRGQLFGLFEVEGEDYLQQTRDIQRMTTALPGLRSRIAVLSANPYVLSRARSVGHLAINSKTPSGKKRLREWINWVTPVPGEVTDEPFPESSDLVPSCRGRGGQGLPLVVCLGTDPTSTLLSLATHQPTEAWIIYDAETPAVVEKAYRLQACRDALPVGTMTFVPTDHLGRVLPAALPVEAFQQQTCRVDITPGTKAQGSALARLFPRQLWSQRTQTGEATPLSGTVQPIPLTAPILKLCAKMNGGTLEHEGLRAKALSPPQRRFLQLYARFLSHWIMETPEQEWQLDRLMDRSCPHGSFSLFSQDGRLGKGRVKFDDRKATGQLPVRGGRWLEETVLNAFNTCGAQDARANVKWAWPKEVQRERESRGERIGYRSEVDVLVRFGFRYLAVSCKVGQKIKRRAAMREIEVVAAEGLGRFCIPFLVRPKVAPEVIEETTHARRGAVVLDLATTADPDLLQQRLNVVFAARSTLE